MADPTIQTFCCHHGNGTDVAVTIMEEFNTDAYNAVCLFSSLLGMFGAIYQVLPRQQFANKHRWFSLSSTRGRHIIIWLAIADLLAAFGVFTRSAIWLKYKNIMPAVDDDASVLFCAISSGITQYFYTATWIWTLIYAIDMRLILSERTSKTKYYHMVAWILPAATTTFGLSLLYFPDAECHRNTSLHGALLRIMPNYVLNYIPIATVMIANPLLYRNSTRDMEHIITSASGQFTSREREILDAIKVKFCVINFVFYLCWLPNLVNGIVLWTLWFHLPEQWIISIWYIMGFMNPLQALFNCLVYRRWTSGSERIILPWRKVEESYPTVRSSQRSLDSSLHAEQDNEEILPLLQNAQSVNGYRHNYR